LHANVRLCIFDGYLTKRGRGLLSKTLKEAALTTRNARKALPAGVHWRGIDPEIHLGYRKGRRGGVWLVRWRSGVGYKQVPLGTADDVVAESTLDFVEASKAAREHVETARELAKAAESGPAPTVRMAVESYTAGRDARDSKRAGRPVRSDASRRLSRYVLGQLARGKRKAVAPAPLADVLLHALRESHLSAWRVGLSVSMKETTRQRLINDLKAALNAAFAADRERLPASLPTIVKYGLRAALHDDDAAPVARDNQILPDADVAKLVKAAREIDEEEEWNGDLFRLVLALAATGARFSQIARTQVDGLQVGFGRLMIPQSRKGKGARSGLTPVPIGQEVVEALAPATTDRKASAALLERWRVEQTGPTTWIRVSRGPWQSSSELRRPWLAIRERAKLPEAIPYALRHSSIVRGIRANLPIRLVAALHDTSVAMIEKHYAKWITSGLEDMARAAVVPLLVDGA
jgi:integrase